MNSKSGNTYGILAILLWSTLAIFTVLSKNIPAFELVSLSFFVASLLGLFMLKIKKVKIKELFKIPFKVYLIGVGGLFVYHFFYFFALKNAPAVEANLINYLWPLLIVLFSSFLPNEKLKSFHIIGSFFGFLGAFLLISKNGSFEFEVLYAKGYIFAFLAALVWSSYSVISKSLSHIPSYSVSGFCIITSVLSFICHLSFETTVIPNKMELFSILMLGLGPVGGAFYLWDYAMKEGDIKLLASFAYFIPLLSTALLIIFSLSDLSSTIIAASFLIVLGSLISSKDFIKELLIKNRYI
ncbi:MAG: EamA family transporter [Campylobacteraceae bacterium]|nr:EamA family transporter [Campylobacteraceae bacterium]